MVQGVPDGSTLFGQPLIGIEDEPYAEVGFEGAAPFLPQLALAMKPASNFIQKEVRLHYNPVSQGDYRLYELGADPGRYHLEPGGYDGDAAVEVPNSMRETPGTFFTNAGSFYYNLDVVSASLVQHF